MHATVHVQGIRLPEGKEGFLDVTNLSLKGLHFGCLHFMFYTPPRIIHNKMRLLSFTVTSRLVYLRRRRHKHCSDARIFLVLCMPVRLDLSYKLHHNYPFEN
jgi:hypothetical protein